MPMPAYSAAEEKSQPTNSSNQHLNSTAEQFHCEDNGHLSQQGIYKNEIRAISSTKTGTNNYSAHCSTDVKWCETGQYAL
jgi:hypothetical protein